MRVRINRSQAKPTSNKILRDKDYLEIKIPLPPRPTCLEIKIQTQPKIPCKTNSKINRIHYLINQIRISHKQLPICSGIKINPRSKTPLTICLITIRKTRIKILPTILA